MQLQLVTFIVLIVLMWDVDCLLSHVPQFASELCLDGPLASSVCLHISLAAAHERNSDTLPLHNTCVRGCMGACRRRQERVHLRPRLQDLPQRSIVHKNQRIFLGLPTPRSESIGADPRLLPSSSAYATSLCLGLSIVPNFGGMGRALGSSARHIEDIKMITPAILISQLLTSSLQGFDHCCAVSSQVGSGGAPLNRAPRLLEISILNITGF